MLATQDETRFGPPARRLSREALARAEAALTFPGDREALRQAAAPLGS